MERAEEARAKEVAIIFPVDVSAFAAQRETRSPATIARRKRRPLPSLRSRAVIEIRKKHISLTDYKLHSDSLPFRVDIGSENFISRLYLIFLFSVSSLPELINKK